MQLSLQLRWHRFLLLTVVALFSAYWISETVRIALIETWGGSDKIKDIERAIALDSKNPELYYRAGVVYLLGVDSCSSGPVPWLRKATELNPQVGRYWLGLARGCVVARDQVCADQSFERAVQLSPMTPSTEWEAAIYYAFTGRAGRSFAQLRRLLESEPDKAGEVFRFTWRAFDPAVFWQEVLATLPNAQVKCAYLAFLSEQKRFELASEYWVQTTKSSPLPTFEEVKPFLQQLMQSQRYSDAAVVWRDLLRLGSVQRAAGENGDNLVFNGGFEQPLLNAGFDWHRVPGNFVAVEVSDSQVHEGKRALRVDYTVPHNTDDDAADQLVIVVPNQKYVLTAYARSDELTSDSGPRLRVEDPQCQTCLDVQSDMTIGTTQWHPLIVTFETGSKTEVVLLSVWRSRSRTFPMDIMGSFWLDSVSLTPAGSTLPDDRASTISLSQ